MNRSYTKIFMAGFVATLAMAAMSIVGSRMGFPIHFWANTLRDHLGHNVLYGYTVYFAVGVVFATLYSHFFNGRLPGTGWRSGTFYGILLGLFSLVVVAPMLHMGFFMGSIYVAAATLAGHVVYGAVLGYVHDA